MKRRLLPASAFAVAILFASALAACGANGAPIAALPNAPASALQPSASGKIQHVVILIQENRSFDDLFATFPHADGATCGMIPSGQCIPLKKMPLYSPTYPSYLYRNFATDYDNGKMDGFYTVDGRSVYQYVDPTQIAPYWALAKKYVLADHMFMTQGSASYTAHQDLIRGGTRLDANRTIVDAPSDGGGAWGCDAPPGTTVPYLTNAGQFVSAGPSPCFGTSYATLRDTLDAKNVSWKYYVPGKINSGFDANIWNAFDSIREVRYGPEWGTKVVWPPADGGTSPLFNDITSGQLAAVSWVIPDFCNSDHPGPSSPAKCPNRDTGPSWVASVVNAIGKSKYWNSTAIVVVWDDWGGFYDHVTPPQLNVQAEVGGPGFRVPMIVVSPYAKKGVVSHHFYTFGSVVRFIEDTFGLPSLNTTDAISRDFAADVFNFAQKPRGFVPVAAKYSQSFFEHQKPSGLPVDTE
jgi:phospholipase C